MKAEPGSKLRLLAEIAGWYGTGAIVGAYLLVSMDVVDGAGWVYQILNLTGALGLIGIAYLKGLRQNVVLNLFWAAIGIMAILKLLGVI
jgi:hypothetical protein